MQQTKKNPNAKLVTPLKISVAVIFFFALATSWQHILITRKDYKINSLLSENDTLKKSLLSINAELVDIKDAADDARSFQKEIIKVIKDIDPKFSTTFASTPTSKPSCGFSDTLEMDASDAVTNAQESIFFLASSQERLRFDAAGLLGKAISIREAFEVTPSLIPITGGYISSEFGTRIDPFTGAKRRHNGIDIAAPVGTPVYASADGVVKRATFDREFGNVIEVLHASGYVTTYGHLSEILTKHNARIKRGETIGRVGKTGLRCAGAHLHFGVSKNGVKQNPKNFMLRSKQDFF